MSSRFTCDGLFPDNSSVMRYEKSVHLLWVISSRFTCYGLGVRELLWVTVSSAVVNVMSYEFKVLLDVMSYPYLSTPE